MLRVKSIGTKITIPMAFIILVTGVATMVVVQKTLQKTLALALEEKGMSACEHLALASLEPILADDRQDLQELLEGKKRAVHDLAYAFLTDRDDNILVHTFSGGFPLHLLWANRITPGQESSVKHLATEEGLIYDFAVPVLLDNKMMGTARVGISRKFMKAAIRDIALISSAIILSILMVGILIAIGLTRRIVKPIKNLHHGTEMIIETGNLEQRVEIKTGDEIEQLANSFNEMVAGLKEKSDELIKSEIKYRTLVESSPDMIHLIDAKGRFLSVNQMEIETLGYSLKEFYEMEIKDIISPEHLEDAKNVIKLVKEKGQVTYETELVSKDGRKIPVEVNAVANYDRDGNFITALGILRDITERKLAEEALSWEARFNAAMAELAGPLLLPTSLDDISYHVLKYAKDFTGSEFGFVGYIDSETGYLVCPTLTREIWDDCQIKGKDIVFEKFRGLWGWVLNNLKPLLTNTPADDPRASGTPAGHLLIHRFLSAPALMGETLVGQVSVANSGHDYTERELVVVERLAALYAIAVQHRRAEGKIREYSENLEQKVKERTQELEEKNKELERFNELFVGREFRIKELKERVKELERKIS